MSTSICWSAAMWKAVVLCIMLASGQAQLLEALSDQQVQCTWGAQYWCSSIATADACRKTDWCTTNHWQYEEIQDVPCSVMQQLVTNVRSLAKISSHSFLTHNEIAVYIVKGCALLHDDESRNQCKQLITEEDILLKLLRLVGSDLSAQSVATAVGVCRRNIPNVKVPGVPCEGLQSCGSPVENMIKGDTEEQADGTGPTCFICRLVMQKLETMLAKNTTEKQIEAALQKVCNVLPPFLRHKCSAFASKYFQKLVELLLRFPPGTVCSVFHLCSDTSEVSVNEIQQSANMRNTRCFLCKLIISQVKSMLSAHTTQDEIKAALEKVCQLLPPLFQSVCNNVVETYEPQLIQMLLSSFTTEQICERLNMCTDVPVAVNEIKQSANMKDTSCLICKLIISQVKSMLSAHTTQDEIKAALEKVCQLLPPLFQSVCNNVVETYEPQLIQMLLSSFTAEQICERLNMCTDVPVSVNEMQLSPSMNGNSKCSLCKLIINKVKSMLSEHTTQDEIKAALQNVCHLLPPVLTSACKSVIEKYEPVLIQMFLSSFTTEKICAQLKMCKKIQVSDKSQFLMFVPEEKETPAPLSGREHCNTCLLTLYHFQSTLNNPNWQNESRTIFHELCNYFKDDQGLCKLLVDSGFSGMVRYIQDLQFPVELCRRAAFCEPTEFVTDDAVPSDSGLK